MSHFKSFLDAPHRPDKGKRILRETSSYESWEYLHDSRALTDQCVPVIGKAEPRAGHFHRGFYRRPIQSIQPFKERQEEEVKRGLKAEKTMAIRREILQEKAKTGGEERKLWEKRKEFKEKYLESQGEYDTFGSSTQYKILTQAQIHFRQENLNKVLSRRAQTSQIIGTGNLNDTLKSQGTLDAFRFEPYQLNNINTLKKSSTFSHLFPINESFNGVESMEKEEKEEKKEGKKRGEYSIFRRSPLDFGWGSETKTDEINKMSIEGKEEKSQE